MQVAQKSQPTHIINVRQNCKNDTANQYLL
jgi:hypothetical protein